MKIFFQRLLFLSALIFVMVVCSCAIAPIKIEKPSKIGTTLIESGVITNNATIINDVYEFERKPL